LWSSYALHNYQVNYISNYSLESWKEVKEMKKIYIGVLGMTLLFLATVAFAKPCGMWATDVQVTAEQQKFFDETRDLRKEMHEKRFALMEAYRVQDPDQQKIMALEKDIDTIREKIQSRAKGLGITTGPGYCGCQGMNCQGPCFNSATDSSPCGNCPQNRPQKGCGTMQGRMM